MQTRETVFSNENIERIMFQMKMQQKQRTGPNPSEVLAKALARAAGLLGLQQGTLARVLGISDATAWRLANGERAIDPDSKEGELALLLVRLYRSLDALVGGNDGQRQAWMMSYNRALNARPIDLITSAAGLTRTVDYLDAARATL